MQTPTPLIGTKEKMKAIISSLADLEERALKSGISKEEFKNLLILALTELFYSPIVEESVKAEKAPRQRPEP